LAKLVWNASVFIGEPLYPADTSTQVTVFDVSGSPTLATIYSDDTGTAKANPFTIDEPGKIQFYGDEGIYNIAVENGSFSDTFEDELLIEQGGGGGGATSFDDLDDVPSYAGNAGRSVKVNDAENALVIGEPDLSDGTASASYSLTLAMWNQFRVLTGSGTIAITIPLDSTLDLPVNYVHAIRPNDAFSGTATWTPESGSVTVEAPAGGTLVAPAGAASAAVKVGANSWIVVGQVEVA
jgi:hypothetical protein